MCSLAVQSICGHMSLAQVTGSGLGLGNSRARKQLVRDFRLCPGYPLFTLSSARTFQAVRPRNISLYLLRDINRDLSTTMNVTGPQQRHRVELFCGLSSIRLNFPFVTKIS